MQGSKDQTTEPVVDSREEAAAAGGDQQPEKVSDEEAHQDEVKTLFL